MDDLTTQQSETIDRLKENPRALTAWFVGEPGIYRDGRIELIGFGKDVAWSYLIATDGTIATESTAPVGEFSASTEIEVDGGA